MINVDDYDYMEQDEETGAWWYYIDNGDGTWECHDEDGNLDSIIAAPDLDDEPDIISTRDVDDIFQPDFSTGIGDLLIGVLVNTLRITLTSLLVNKLLGSTTSKRKRR